MSEGSTESVTDGAVSQAEEEAFMEGFAEAMADPAARPEGGEPEEAEAVETSEAEETPAKSEEETGDTPDESDDDAGESDAEQTVNFDGFSDGQKATWERLLKAGYVTPEEVERSRTESLFQANYTKKTMALAEKRKAFAAEMEERKEDLALLETIRGDDHLHDAWLRMSRGEIPSDEDADSELVTAKKAAEIAEERLEKREAERTERTKAKQAKYDAKKDELSTAIQETMALKGITKEQAAAYLALEEAALPTDVDPILHFEPERLQERLMWRHEVATAKAEAAELREQLGQKTSKATRTAKQSLPPARRVTSKGGMTLMEQTEADLGIDPDWSNVQGFGHRDVR